MGSNKAKVIDGKCRYEFIAKFVHIFQTDPLDKMEALYSFESKEGDFLEACASFWRSFTEAYQPVTVEDCKIHINIISMEETTFYGSGYSKSIN